MNRLGHNKIFKSFRIKIKALLQKRQWKEALIFLCFVLLAGAFWLLQSLQQEYEIPVSIPLEYKNFPPNVAFKDTLPSSLDLKVKDKGSVLLNYTFGRRLLPIEINFQNKSGEKKALHVSKKELENDIRKQLLATSTLVGFEPQSLNIAYEKKHSKEVPIIFDGEIATKAGYKVVGSITINPSSIEIYASRSDLDSIDRIYTNNVYIKNVDKFIKRTIPLKKIKGVSFSQESVSISANVEQYTEKTLNIPVTCKDLPSQYVLRTFPSSVDVSCNVPLSSFKDLSSDEFSINIPFSELEQNISGKIELKLEKKPDYVDNIVLTPNHIEFILEHNIQ